MLRSLSNQMLPWISSAAFLLKDQNQFDLGTCPYPDEMEMQCFPPLVFVDIACVFHLNHKLVCKRNDDACK